MGPRTRKTSETKTEKNTKSTAAVAKKTRGRPKKAKEEEKEDAVEEEDEEDVEVGEKIEIDEDDNDSNQEESEDNKQVLKEQSAGDVAEENDGESIRDDTEAVSVENEGKISEQSQETTSTAVPETAPAVIPETSPAVRPDPAAAAAAAAAAITAAATASMVPTVSAPAVVSAPTEVPAPATTPAPVVPGVQPFSFSASAAASAVPPATEQPDVETIIMAVPPDKVGVLIGSKGAIIHDMQAKCGCKMFVKQEGIPDGLPRELIITGVKEKIEEAKALALAVMEEGPIGLKTSLTGQPLVNFEMECSANLVGRVIGAQGATIKDLQLRSGAKIHVNQDFPEGVPRKVLIAGTQECVNNAVRMVQLVMEQGPAGLATLGYMPGMPPIPGMPSSYAAPGYGQQVMGLPPSMPSQLNTGLLLHVMECPKQVVGKLIGRGGETIQLIQQKSGCKVQIDQQVPEGHPCKINMNGNTQAIQNAIQIVQEIMTNGVSRVQSMPPMPSVTAGLTSGYSVPGVHHHPQGASNMAYGGQFQMQQRPQQYLPQQYAAPGAFSMPQAYQQQQQQQQQQQTQTSFMQQPQYVQAMQAPAAPKPVSPWTEHTAEGGHKYWHNASTGVSTWEKPAGF